MDVEAIPRRLFVNQHAVAEFAFALLMQCSRKILENLQEVRNGGWTKHEGQDLAGKTLGIVGLDNIGAEKGSPQRLRGDILPQFFGAELGR